MGISSVPGKLNSFFMRSASVLVVGNLFSLSSNRANSFMLWQLVSCNLMSIHQHNPFGRIKEHF